MRNVGGLVGAGICAAVAFFLATAGTHNLPGSVAGLAQIGIVGCAAIVGFVAGSAVAKRAGRDRSHIGLFSALAGGVAGGTLGCVYALAITAAYLSNYATWPQDRMDQVFVLLAYPIFGAFGLCLGGAVGLIGGLLLGGALGLGRSSR